MLGAGLPGLIGLALLVSPGAEVPAGDAPAATLAHQTTERLTVSVTVPASGKARTLAVELLDAGGRVVGTAEHTFRAGATTRARVLFGRLAAKPEQLTVRCRLDGRTSEVGLAKILLARAHETALSTSAEFFAGSTAELACKVQGVKSLTETVPLVADVAVELVGGDGKARPLYEGKTSNEGVARVSFRVPEVPPGQYTLQVKTRSAFGEETLKHGVKIASAPKVLVTTDKPLYQPGQTIHLRALALRAFDLAPAASQPLVFEVEDAKGNKVYKKELQTSEFGIAASDFALADEVNAGEYRIRAILGDHRSEKAVTVKKYVLPKFKVALKTDKSFYLPKETVKGTLQADYFFGKPVAEGKVEIDASTFDVAFKKFTTFKGTTDKNGHLKFEVTLPDYFVGHPLAKGDAIVKLDAKLTDTADHVEAVTRTYPVSDQPIRVSFLPEGGRIIPGLENRIFVATLYPDGSTAACQVEVVLGQKAEGKPVASLRTNATGLAEFTLTPKPEQLRAGGHGQQVVEMLGGTQQRWGPNNVLDLSVRASDDKGAKATATAALSAEPLGENVLLRLDKVICKGGETLRLDVLTSAGMPTVYVDVVKSRQTMLTRWLDVKDGKAATSLDLPEYVFGTLEVHAYQILSTGEVVRDARVVYVNPASELRVKVSPDREVYTPGAQGAIRFEVTDAKGKPAPAALGVLIVDEAVYALQEIQPGLEKVFFTLQEELLKPQAQAVYKPGENLETIVRQEEVPAAKQQAAQALLSAVRPKAPPRWQVDPAVDRRRKFDEQLAQVGFGLYQYASSQASVLVQERRTGKWVFRPDLLRAAINSGSLGRELLRDPLGGDLTLERLASLESGFAAEKFGVAVTRARMFHVFSQIIHLANNNQARWLKGGKWTLPADVLTTAARNAGSDLFAKDAWGRDIKLVKRSAKEKNTTGHAQFDDVVLASAGPDGKFGTADDVVFQGVDHGVEGWAWWRLGRDLTASDRTRARRQIMFDMWFERGANQFGMLGAPRGGLGAVRPAMAGGGGGFGGGMPAPMAKAAEKSEAPPADSPATATSAPAGEAPLMRLREYFPETLLWRPALITDDAGRATLEVPFADSITTWRLSASASSRGGQLGGATAPLRVFQDFFVDLDLPVALTQNDEVAFPVAVYNYLKTPQTVTLELKPEAWFDLIDAAGAKRSLKLEQGQVTSVRFRIKARKVGTFPLTVEARGSKMSDAIKRQIEVVPDGKAFEQVFTDRLKGGVKHTITIPPVAIDDASKLFVKVYPGVMSQVLEGVDGLIRLPGG
jgi:hypothetical protein